MSAKEQYEEFYLWLVTKWNEIYLDYDGDRAATEVRAKYIALLRQTTEEMIWTSRQIEELQNA